MWPWRSSRARRRAARMSVTSLDVPVALAEWRPRPARAATASKEVPSAGDASRAADVVVGLLLG